MGWVLEIQNQHLNNPETNFELIAKMFKIMCTRNGDTRNKQYYISVSDRWYTVKFQTEWINYIKSAEWELMKGG